MNSYIKDSANNYTLYIDQGTTFSLDLLASTFTATDITNLTFSGTIKQGSESYISTFDFEITKTLTVPQKITLKIPSDITANLKKDRYGFDVMYQNATLDTFKAFGGSVIVTHNYTSL